MCLSVWPCTRITSSAGYDIAWVQEMRYLVAYITKSRVFKCSLDHAKRFFYRAANSIFGKIGRIASEEVILRLIRTKCVPVLLYGLEACNLTKSQITSLDFVLNRFFMKLFGTNNIKVITEYQTYFSFKLPSTLLAERVKKLKDDYELQGHGG